MAPVSAFLHRNRVNHSVNAGLHFMKRNSLSVMKHRKALKEKGWRQLSMLVPDETIADKLLRYKWLLFQQERRLRKQLQLDD